MSNKTERSNMTRYRIEYLCGGLARSMEVDAYSAANAATSVRLHAGYRVTIIDIRPCGRGGQESADLAGPPL
jgi:hypothetical protein